MVRALLWDRSRAPLPIQLTISHEKYSIDAHFLPVPLPRVTYRYHRSVALHNPL